MEVDSECLWVHFIIVICFGYFLMLGRGVFFFFEFLVVCGYSGVIM